MKKNRIVIAAPKSGSGKTLITISLMKALSLSGKKVSAFKCGPDYIDPMFHKKILNLPSKNLDLFFCNENQIKNIFLENNESDISVIEGVMGLYDGLGGFTQEASTYDLAKVLEAPVILVIDAKGMGYSILAEVLGFKSLDKYNLIKGIILNNLSSMIYEGVKKNIEEKTGIKVLGYFPTQKELKLESRYLGLKLPDEISDIQKMTELAASELVKNVNINEIEKLADNAPELFPDNISLTDNSEFTDNNNLKKTRIAVAKDEAFCFYYDDNLKLLEKLGAELVYFSPLKNQNIPENVSGIILGGGYPELFAKELSGNSSMKASIKNAIEQGMPSLAECGGFMYLHESVKLQDGTEYKMAGVIKGTCEFKNKLVRFGYIDITEKNNYFIKSGKIKGHEFHYFDSTNNGTDCLAQKPVTNRNWDCAHVSENHWWGFAHLYYLSNIDFAKSFVEKCRGYKK